ncbi:hypothetical protein F383_28614 [Gossypium arboreum]|nr:hypothetical protein F383_28614 [Gossypium arboreum]
MCCRKEI